MKEKSSMEASQAKEELYKYILNYVISKDMDMEDATDVIGSLSGILKDIPKILILSSVLGKSTNEVLDGLLKGLERYKKNGDLDEGDVESDKGFKVNVEVTIKGEKDEDTDCSDTD